MGKNIVICFDAAGGRGEESLSNVRRLFSVLDRDQHKQVSHINRWGFSQSSRVGSAWSAIGYLAFGAGLVTSLTQAYRFLIEQYEAGDRLYLFGFSKGAFAAQALGAILHMFGLVAKGDEILLEDTIASFLTAHSETFTLARDTHYLYSQICKPHFVGLWETPASIGLVYSPLALPYTSLNPDIEIGRHALAIDERRSMYRPNFWRPAAKAQDIKEVWFAGVHSDVGGSYPEPESGLALIAFEWMVAEARAAGLLVNQSKLDFVLNDGHQQQKDFPAPLHNSLRGVWWLLEMLPTRYLTSGANAGEYRASFRIPLGRPRFIPEGATIHESVFDRMASTPGYTPSNLPQTYDRAVTSAGPFDSAFLGAGKAQGVDAIASETSNIVPRSAPVKVDDGEAIDGASVPIQKSATSGRLKIFLCYVPSDELVVSNLASRIKRAGYDSWIASEKLQPGDDWKTMLPEIVRAADLFLVCLSTTFTSKPDLAQKILKYALDVADERPENSKFIIPVKLENCVIPFKLQDWTPVNYYEQTGWDRLLSAFNSYPSRAL
jgi:hypothetical protein